MVGSPQVQQKKNGCDGYFWLTHHQQTVVQKSNNITKA
jgi:hypothetical protein